MQTSVGKDLLAATLAEASARSERVTWAGTLGNGAALLALVGLVGNVADPDAALAFLIAPMALFMSGLTVGGVAAALHPALINKRVQFALDASIIESHQSIIANPELPAIQLAVAMLESRVGLKNGPDVADIVSGLERLTLATRIIKLRSIADGYAQQTARRWLNGLGACSLGLLGLGMATILISHVGGARLQPGPVAPKPVVQEATRPARPDAAR